MLDKLPSHVWSNPNLKWLDPANGIGNFPVVIMERLMIGLADVIQDPYARKRHIITNMLYMVELNPDNVKLSRDILGHNSNIACSSFLDEAWKAQFGLSEFDIIVGNPPYSTYKNYKKRKGGGSSLWIKFVTQSIQIMRQNGYLCFVHPSAWRKPKAKKTKVDLFSLMTKTNQLVYLEMHDPIDGYRVFDVGTRYDWYVLCKQPPSEKTTVVDDLGHTHQIDFNEWEFLPNSRIDMIRSLLKEDNGRRCDILFSRSQYGSDKRWVQEAQTENFKYPLVHATNKKGVRYFYSSTPTPTVRNWIKMFGVKKVIFGDVILYNSDNAALKNVVIDMEGKYGMTQHAMAIEVDSIEDAKILQSVLQSKPFGEFLKACSFSNYQIDYRIFQYLKKGFWKELA